MIPIFVLIFLVVLVPLIRGSLTRSGLGQFYHICIYDIVTMQVPDKKAFMLKLEKILKEGHSNEVHWQNALKRFEHVRPYLDLGPSVPANTTDNDTLLSMVQKYVQLSKIALSNNRSLAEVLFDDAFFYWDTLKIQAERDVEKRKALLQVLMLLRYIGMHFMTCATSVNVEWVEYYSDSTFLRSLLKAKKKTETTSKSFGSFLGHNADLETAQNIILDLFQEPSELLQKRLEKYRSYNLAASTLFSDTKNELERSAIHSQLGPLQDYFPGFMRERPTDLNRALLNLTLSKRYLEGMRNFERFPSNVLKIADIAFSHQCNVYYLHWKTLPRTHALSILSKFVLRYIIERSGKIIDNAIHGCTAKTFDAAVMRYGLPAITTPPFPQDSELNSIVDLQRMESRLILDSYAYRAFYKFRFLGQQEDMEVHFQESMLKAPEDKNYAALVRSWIKAKTYPGLEMPFIISRDQIEILFSFPMPALQKSLKQLKDNPIQEEYRREYARKKLELEMTLFEMSEDPVWRKLQQDYIRRLIKFL